MTLLTKRPAGERTYSNSYATGRTSTDSEGSVQYHTRSTVTDSTG